MNHTENLRAEATNIVQRHYKNGDFDQLEAGKDINITLQFASPEEVRIFQQEFPQALMKYIREVAQEDSSR